MNFNTGWYVLYVKSRHEKKAYNSLKEKSLDVFLPLIKTMKEWSDRKKIVLKPLFPSYVFVYLNSQSGFHKALSANGVSSCIRFGKEYARITDQEINNIKLLIGAEDATDIETNVKYPKAGETRKILHGALTGLECEVINVNNINKIIVRIDSLQQNITATIPSHFLSEAS